MITIIDYGMGNLGSIQNMFRRIGVRSIVSGDALAVAAASKVVLPGVGAFDTAMRRISESGLLSILNHKALVERVPLLGICLGMQLMTNSSEEGVLPGLGWIPARTRRFPSSASVKVPHMGWNRVSRTRAHALTDGFADEARFYFVHSYYVSVGHDEDAILRSTHGVEFDAAIARGNLCGVQFHPEKSHQFGKRLLGNFAAAGTCFDQG